MELPGDITDLLMVDNDNDGSENTFFSKIPILVAISRVMFMEMFGTRAKVVSV